MLMIPRRTGYTGREAALDINSLRKFAVSLSQRAKRH